MAKKKNKTTASTIDYSGEVTIKVMKGSTVINSKRIKNTGTYNLFHGIALALIGANTSEIINFLPHYLGTGTSTKQQISPVDAIDLEEPNEGRAKLVNMSVDRDGINQGYVSSFIATIPLSKDIIIGELGLFATQSGKDMLARVVLPESVSYSANYTLVIE